MKTTTILLLIGVVSAASAAPQLVSNENQKTPYSFAYGVNAPDTGDFKEHKETITTQGVTEGEYRWLQPNGLYRVTRYTADDTGYRAIVTEEPGENNPTYYTNNVKQASSDIFSSQRNQHSFSSALTESQDRDPQSSLDSQDFTSQSNIQGSNPFQPANQGSNTFKGNNQDLKALQSRNQDSSPFRSRNQGSQSFQPRNQNTDTFQSRNQGSNTFHSRNQGFNSFQSGNQRFNNFQSANRAFNNQERNFHNQAFQSTPSFQNQEFSNFQNQQNSQSRSFSIKQNLKNQRFSPSQTFQNQRFSSSQTFQNQRFSPSQTFQNQRFSPSQTFQNQRISPSQTSQNQRNINEGRITSGSFVDAGIVKDTSDRNFDSRFNRKDNVRSNTRNFDSNRNRFGSTNISDSNINKDVAVVLSSNTDRFTN